MSNGKLVPVVGLIVLSFLALGAVLFVSPGPESQQRLALFFGLVGTGVAALVALIRSDQAASRLNGGLDERITSAVFRAQSVRRSTDVELPTPKESVGPGAPRHQLETGGPAGDRVTGD